MNIFYTEICRTTTEKILIIWLAVLVQNEQENWSLKIRSFFIEYLLVVILVETEFYGYSDDLL